MAMIYSCVAQLHVVDTNEDFSCQHGKTQALPKTLALSGLGWLEDKPQPCPMQLPERKHGGHSKNEKDGT